MQPGALPEDALRDLVNMLVGLDMDEVREELAKREQEKTEWFELFINAMSSRINDVGIVVWTSAHGWFFWLCLVQAFRVV